MRIFKRIIAQHSFLAGFTVFTMAVLSLSTIPCEAETLGNNEITVPAGFSVSLYHHGVASGARHIAQCKSGILFMHTSNGIAALIDADADGHADKVRRFGSMNGTGVRCYKEWLYVSSNSAIFRYRLGTAGLPEGKLEKIAELPSFKQHAAKAFTFDQEGNLYVDIGAPSNSCQKQDRVQGSLGQMPCPLLKNTAGIWRFKAEKRNQSFEDGTRYASGIRNAVALRWNDQASALFLVQHGRDQLYPLFSDHYTAADNARLPAEEFHRVEQGSDIGWPYTYWDGIRGMRMQAPEYGGDGKKQAQSAKFQRPLFAFPAHWAPNDLLFYDGSQFPAEYRGGAFIAFHGSWDRAPFPQEGYKVVFLPFGDGKFSDSFIVFADGFAGGEDRKARGAAEHRPMGLALASDGGLFISDSRKGRVWKVRYSGS